jgi:flavin-dependent thymidylate synthase
MNVTLIDYTGAGNSDPLYAARLLAYTKSTRLEQSTETMHKFMEMEEPKLMEELDYISKTIRSSWEFVEFTFQITGVTRAFTHQFVRTRTASYAQQAQRVVNMSGVPNMVPQTVYDSGMVDVWDSAISAISDAYTKLKNAGIPTQDCRGLLPTNVLTNIIAKMNLRTFADLIGKRSNLRAQGEYADVARLMELCVLEKMPWVKNFIRPERTSTPALDAILASALGSSSPIDLPNVNQALKELDALKGIWG